MNTIHPHAPHVAPGGSAPNAALLIDFDNVTMGIRSDLQTQLRRLLDTDLIKGKVAVQRAYADWRRYPQYIAPLSETSIDLIFAPASGSSKKNATDIRLAIDALELVFTRPEIGTFILLSGDSDFSSLVLKLKEYGKYVIGVGIRESASDLLVQNCHEYYGYSELTGLTPAAGEVTKRRDPWELVVEAVFRMQQSNDIMRSDRLKQVMQDIDPHFDEKDAGVSKFSRFVVEAERRGLLTVRKMENGQLEVGVGPDANVPLAVVAPDQTAAVAPAPPRRRSAGPDVAKVEGMPLGDAFRLLKRSMEMIGALDTEATDAPQVRELMMQLSHSDQDPLFESERFEKFLLQASDASAIEIVKSGDTNLLKLNPDADVFKEDPAAVQRPTTRRKRTGTRGRARSASGPTADAETVKPVADDAVGDVVAVTVPVETVPTQSPAEAKVEETAPPARPARRRGLGARSGSRGRRPAEKRAAVETQDSPEAPTKTVELKAEETVAAPSVDPPNAEADAPKKRPARKRSPRGRGQRKESNSEVKTTRAPTDEVAKKEPQRDDPAPPPPQKPAEAPAEAVEEGGLFQRVSTAVQRALLGDDG